MIIHVQPQYGPYTRRYLAAGPMGGSPALSAWYNPLDDDFFVYQGAKWTYEKVRDGISDAWDWTVDISSDAWRETKKFVKKEVIKRIKDPEWLAVFGTMVAACGGAIATAGAASAGCGVAAESYVAYEVARISADINEVDWKKLANDKKDDALRALYEQGAEKAEDLIHDSFTAVTHNREAQKLIPLNYGAYRDWVKHWFLKHKDAMRTASTRAQRAAYCAVLHRRDSFHKSTSCGLHSPISRDLALRIAAETVWRQNYYGKPFSRLGPVKYRRQHSSRVYRGDPRIAVWWELRDWAREHYPAQPRPPCPPIPSGLDKPDPVTGQRYLTMDAWGMVCGTGPNAQRAMREMVARAKLRRLWGYRRLRLQVDTKKIRAEYDALIARGSPKLIKPSGHLVPIALLAGAGAWFALNA